MITQSNLYPIFIRKIKFQLRKCKNQPKKKKMEKSVLTEKKIYMHFTIFYLNFTFE